jgi:rhodanese-related sulfurtransferase
MELERRVRPGQAAPTRRNIMPRLIELRFTVPAALMLAAVFAMPAAAQQSGQSQSGPSSYSGDGANASALAGLADVGPAPQAIDGATTVDTEALAALLDTGRTVLVFDVRDAKAFAKGHLRGAQHLSSRWSRVVRDYRVDLQPLGQDKAVTIVIYGRNDRDRAAQAAVQQAVREGFHNVLWMRGGVEQWGRTLQASLG